MQNEQKVNAKGVKARANGIQARTRRCKIKASQGMEGARPGPMNICEHEVIHHDVGILESPYVGSLCFPGFSVWIMLDHHDPLRGTVRGRCHTNVPC